MASKIKIGILREGKVPTDRRAPLTPPQARLLQDRFAQIEVIAQSSPIRCFTDEEYREAGIEVHDSVGDCDILLGVKEVPVDWLIPAKTYLFFSHTIKKQPYNRGLLQAVLARNIRLIDYETLKDESGNRVVAFGRWAGIVGAYNALWTYGRRYRSFSLRRAIDCADLEELLTELKKVKLSPIQIVVTGGGRVAHGAMEILQALKVRQVTPAVFLRGHFETPVFTQLNPADYHCRKGAEPFSEKEFFSSPELFTGDFRKYTRVSDLLIAAAFWDPRAPVLFTREEMTQPDFRIRIIADVTCDIDGSIPSTVRPSTIDEPLYDYDPQTGTEQPALSDDNYLTVMAIDNLPCELPVNASESFGQALLDEVLPRLINNPNDPMISRATIARDGKLTPDYEYLKDFVG